MGESSRTGRIVIIEAITFDVQVELRLDHSLDLRRLVVLSEAYHCEPDHIVR